MSERAFDKFTKRAKQVLQIATEEARAFNHPYIGTEHILLGLIREGEGVAARVLDDLGVKLPQARHAVEFIVGMGEGPTRQDQDLTARAKKVIAYAVDEAKRLNHHYIGTEHLLLGLVRNGEGVATGVLTIMGVSLEQVRTQVIRVLRQGTGSGMERASASVPSSGVSSNPQAQQPSKTPYLDAIGIDLTEMAKDGRLEPVIGRVYEIESLLQILLQRWHNNPIVIGEPGVGKTSLVHGLAQRIVANDVPDIIQGRRIVELDSGALAAGATQSGLVEDHLRRLLQEVKDTHAILFIDNLHAFFSASDHEDLVPLGKIIQQALSNNSIQIIGETYPLEYRNFIARNTILQRCTQPIPIASPTSEDVRRILSGLKTSYEDYHQLRISHEAINAAIVFAGQVRPDLSLLEKGLRLIDEAAARVNMYRSTTPPSLRDALRGLEAIRKEREAAIEDQQIELAADLQDKEERMLSKIAVIERDMGITGASNVSERPYVTEDDIAAVIDKWQNLELSDQNIAQMSGEQAMQLHIALLSAFPTVGAVEQMVRFELNQNLNVIASSDNLSQRVWEVIRWSEANGKVSALIQGASRQSPGNPELRHFLNQYTASDKTENTSSDETAANDIRNESGS